MNIEIQTVASENKNIPVRLTRRGKLAKKAAEIVLGTGVVVGSVVAGIEATDSDFKGEQQVQITDENNITELVSEHVDGVSDGHLNATIHEAGDRNPDVLGDGDIDHDDIGKTVELPKSVD